MVTALETQSTPWKVSTNQAAVKQEHGDSVDIWFPHLLVSTLHATLSQRQLLSFSPQG